MLRKGFMGAYQFRKVAGSSRKDQGLERMHEKPDKNLYSHPMDALQYGLSRVIGTKMIDPDWDYYEERKEESRRRYDYRDYRGRSAITGY